MWSVEGKQVTIDRKIEKLKISSKQEEEVHMRSERESGARVCGGTIAHYSLCV